MQDPTHPELLEHFRLRARYRENELEESELAFRQRCAADKDYRAWLIQDWKDAYMITATLIAAMARQVTEEPVTAEQVIQEFERPQQTP